MSKDKPLGLEESLEKLESIVSSLESGEHSLEESLAKFEEGIQLGKHCRDLLSKAETRVQRLIEVDEEGNVDAEDFDGAEDAD